MKASTHGYLDALDVLVAAPCDARRAGDVSTREQWLHWGVDELRPMFKDGGFALPQKMHVSVGFPSHGALSRTRRVVGQCWHQGSADGFAHVFISPVLTTGVEALDTLVHELCHVVTPGTGHKAPFVKAGKAVGLTDGKPKSLAAGAELLKTLERLNAQSPYPHSGLSADAHGPVKKQSTRLIKAGCPECGYVCRVTRKWLDAIGAPLCPVHALPMEEDAA